MNGRLNMGRVWLRSCALIKSAAQFEVHSHSSSSRAFVKNGEQDSIPKYNYGLPGKGKGSKTKRKGRLEQHRVPIHAEGQVVFGVHPVTLALSAHLRSSLHAVYMEQKHRDSRASPAFTAIQDLAASQQIPVHFVPKNTLTLLSGNRPHQGVCLDAGPRDLPHCDQQQLLQGVEWTPHLLWLMLYNVQDPMNFGAILRSSYFLGVDRVLVPSIHSCALSPVVSKASAGAMEVMDLYHIDGSYRSLQHLTQVWQGQGGQVVGTASEGRGSRPLCRLHDFTTSAPTLLIVGNEGRGIDADVVDLCDTLLTIPPPPSPSSSQADSAVTSLNVSVATGILIHWLRTVTSRP